MCANHSLYYLCAPNTCVQLYFGVEKCCICTCQALQTGALWALFTQRTISKRDLIWNIENFPDGPAHLGHKYRLHHRVILKSELILLDFHWGGGGWG